MTAREHLHRLIDVLPETELDTAERVLTALVLAARATPEARATLAAELDPPSAA